MPPREIPRRRASSPYPETPMSPDLETAIASARDATIHLHSLLTINGIQFKELHQLPVWPAGMREAHKCWTACMAGVVKVLARENGVPDATKLPGPEQVALTNRAYDLVMS
jgi:hypothetical protein